MELLLSPHNGQVAALMKRWLVTVRAPVVTDKKDNFATMANRM
jgi:hypothetical protein